MPTRPKENANKYVTSHWLHNIHSLAHSLARLPQEIFLHERPDNMLRTVELSDVQLLSLAFSSNVLNLPSHRF
eukprot:2530781-Amphidinium_carterae.1